MTQLKQATVAQRAVVPSTGTYNAIVNRLNSMRGTPQLAQHRGDRTLVAVRNAGNYVIPYGSVVALPCWKPNGGIFAGVCPAYWYGEIGEAVQVMNPPWGIAREEIPVGGMGSIQVTGIHVAYIGGIAYSATNQYQYVSPTANGQLALSRTGSARLLSYDAEGYATILLNTGAAVGGAYEGPFAARFDMKDGVYPSVKVNSGLILAGTERVEVPETYLSLGDIALPPYYSFMVYAILVYNEHPSHHGEGEYVAELGIHNYNSGYPAPVPTAEMCVWRIASYDKDTKNLTQIQYGDIQVAGRCVR